MSQSDRFSEKGDVIDYLCKNWLPIQFNAIQNRNDDLNTTLWKIRQMFPIQIKEDDSIKYTVNYNDVGYHRLLIMAQQACNN